MPVLAKRKVFSKNKKFLQLSWNKNPIVVIPYIYKCIPLIFCIPRFVSQGRNLSWVAKPGLMILTLLSELLKVSMDLDKN